MNIIDKIIEDYKNKAIIIFYNGDSICYRNTHLIFLSNRVKDNPNDDNVFELLHELGHIMNNEDGMRICEEEYYATVWAIKESKKYKLRISDNCKELYQTYINGYARNRKTISVKDVVLNW